MRREEWEVKTLRLSNNEKISPSTSDTRRGH